MDCEVKNGASAIIVLTRTSASVNAAPMELQSIVLAAASTLALFLSHS
jgi:hypothetical protein